MTDKTVARMNDRAWAVIRASGSFRVPRPKISHCGVARTSATLFIRLGLGGCGGVEEWTAVKTEQISLFKPALKYAERQDTVAVADGCENGDAELDLYPPAMSLRCPRSWSKHSTARGFRKASFKWETATVDHFSLASDATLAEELTLGIRRNSWIS